MSIELDKRIDELEGKLRSFELELHGIRRMAAAERTARPEQRGTAEAAPASSPPVAATPPVAPPPRAVRPQPAPASPPPRPAARRRPPRRSLSDVLERIDLFGPRGLAVAGGVVTLLGIVFFFVLAANRGWIGPAERVAFGAAASLLAFVAGVVVRYRFGQLHAALASVGAGIAGAYATLAAATVLYGLMPAAAALPCATGIAAAGLVIALVWSSELLAALGLLGAVLSPAALALDEGVTAAGTAFAVVVLGSIAVVAVRRGWVGLLSAGIAGTLPQVAWLVLDAQPRDAAAVAVAAAAVGVLLATAFAWELSHRSDGVGQIAAGLTGVGVGSALFSTVVLFPDPTSQAIVFFAYAAALAGLCVVVAGMRLELAYLVGAGALGLSGVATADVLTGASLAIVFAVECCLASFVAYKVRERRFVLAAFAYLALGLREALRTQGSFAVGDASAALAAAGLGACAAAALAVGLLSPVETRRHTAAGVLAMLEPLLDWLGRARVNVRAALASLAFVLAALAVDDVLSRLPLTLAYACGATLLAVTSWRFAELRLVPFAVAAAGLTAVHTLAVDAPVMPSLYPELSAGATGAIGVAIAAAVVGACAALLPKRQRGIVWLGSLDGVERSLGTLPRRFADVRLSLAGAAAALGLGASGLALGGLGDVGHVMTIVLWCAVGLAAVIVATPAGHWLVASGAGVLLVASLVKASGYDWVELGEDQGAVELLVCCAALLFAGFVVRSRSRSAAPLTFVPAGAAVVTTLAVPFALDELVASDRLGGVAMLVVAAVYAGLAVVAQRRPELRNLATAMWIPGLLALMQSEALLLQNRIIVVAYAATAVGLASLGLRIRESRLVSAALVLLGGTTLVTLAALTPPTHLLEASEAPGSSAWALAACAVATAVIGVLIAGERGRQLGWISGGLLVYVASLAILELAQRVSSASVQTDFERGHTAVSALWGLIGLGLLIAGLLRRTQALRLGGLALFGISLAKLFLYDLSTLSSITRAFSFIAVGALLLTGGFFLQRLGSRLDDGDAGAPAVTR